ncbi:universal stress protein [Tersicoccus solisilvae]|uniref:Universal stress protein n=1 Tax=Tersicoccus solisilvae TaxID=1882339 RepID=A0ABQ1P1X1_9MICC|nr:universal stress protein [Tersicoccus solisilvae]GGC89152.1 universal stress protein [Tersicoccus solisilvae]
MTINNAAEPILVGVDGSDSSVEALREAAVLADALQAPLEVVMVWEFPDQADYYGISSSVIEGDARASLDDTVRAAFEEGPPDGLTAGLLYGPTKRTLIERSRHARMLVLGSRGHGGFMGMLLGSVSAACAEHAHCPVLVVHRPRVTEDEEQADGRTARSRA